MTKRTLSSFVLLALALFFVQAGEVRAQKGGGGSPGGFSASPSSVLDFGTVSVDAGGAGLAVRLWNQDPTSVDLEIPATMGAFSILNGAGSYTLELGEYADLYVQFDPSLEGTESVEFYPSEDSDLVLSFVGEGAVSPDCGQSLAEVDAGSVEVGSTDAVRIFVDNNSGATQGIAFQGGCNAFSLASPGFIQVPDGQVGFFDVDFAPQYEGEYVGEFTTGCGTTVWLIGTGVDPMGKGPGTVASAAGTNLSMAAAPNPMRESSHIRYAYIGEGTLSAELRIVDVRGRVLRTESLEITPGSHVWKWDRRDGSGNSVASGVYFLELVAPGSTARQKVTVLR